MAFFFLADTLPGTRAATLGGTLAGTGFQSFRIGCPARVSRCTEEQIHGHRRASMPPEFVPPEFVKEKHDLEWPARLGLRVGLAGEVVRQNYSPSALRRRF